MESMIKYKSGTDLIVNVTPHAFRVSAEEYYAYVVEYSPINPPFSPVPYALLCQAIELKLKSHLWTKIGREKVKKLGHHLIAAYEALDCNFKVLSSDDVAVLSLADAVYNDEKGFHYVQPIEFEGGLSLRWPALLL
jgi:hypothetical protein